MLAEKFKAEKQNTNTTWTVRTVQTQHGLAKAIELELGILIAVGAIEAEGYNLLVAQVVGRIVRV